MPVWSEVKRFVVPDYVQGEEFVIALGIVDEWNLPKGPLYVDDVPIVVYRRGLPRRS